MLNRSLTPLLKEIVEGVKAQDDFTKEAQEAIQEYNARRGTSEVQERSEFFEKIGEELDRGSSITMGDLQSFCSSLRQ